MSDKNRMPSRRDTPPSSLPDYRWPERLRSWRYLPLRWVLGIVFHIAHGVGRLVSRLRPNKPTALVIRTDGIGDALLSEPMIEAFVRHCSPFQVHLWAPKPVCELFGASEMLAKCLPVPRGFKAGNLAYFHSFTWRWRLGYRLGRWSFDVVLYAAHSPEPLGNWLMSSTRTRDRWYCPGDLHNQFDWQRDFASAKATTRLESSPPHAHELKRNAHFAAQWNAVVIRSPRLDISAKAHRAAERQLNLWRSHRQTLNASGIVGVVATGSMRVNRYPDQKWAEVIGRLWREERTLCALIGGPEDRASLNQVARLLHGVPHLRITYRLDVQASAALVSGLDAILTVDTGLAHLAIARHTPTVALSTGGTPGRFLPWPNAPHSIVLNRPMSCDGCRNRCSLSEPECITSITPDEIIDSLQRLRERRLNPQRHNQSTPEKLPLREAV